MVNLIDKKGYLHCPQCRKRTEQRIRADTLVRPYDEFLMRLIWKSVVF